MKKIKEFIKEYWKVSLLIFIIWIVFLSIPTASSLTEEERVRNNALIEQKQATGEVGSGRVPPLYRTPREASFLSQLSRTIEMNPFLVIGIILVLIVILIVIIIALTQRDSRL